MKVEWNANAIRFADIAPGDCFSTPDGSEIMLKVRKPVAQPDLPDAISLQSGEPVKVQQDTHVFAITSRISASIDHDYLRKRTGLSSHPQQPRQPPQVPTQAPPSAQQSQIEILHPNPVPAGTGQVLRPN